MTVGESSNRGGARRLLLPTLVTAALLGTGGVWVAGADERRVDGACDIWLGQREALRGVLAETEEAVGRAEAAHADGTVRYFNDADETIGAIRAWEGTSTRVLDALREDADGSRLEASAIVAFAAVETGLRKLRSLIETGTAEDVGKWRPEVEARYQMVDDTCLAAARAG